MKDSRDRPAHDPPPGFRPDRRSFLTMLGLLTAGAARLPARAAEAPWTTLFNGRDLTGWEITLGHSGNEPDPRDPTQVFRVVQEDGEPALRVSGAGLGGIRTTGTYENYHLELEFKWGEKRFPPRANEPRDSGLLYHGILPANRDTGWIESLELGILEGGETGDFWSVPGVHGQRIVVDVRGDDIPEAQRRYGDQAIRFNPRGKPFIGVSSGILNFPDREKPRGEWNRLELICLGSTALHVANGRVNLALTNARRKINGREEPVTRGYLQLQCEGAETFFRRLRLRSVEAIPVSLREAAGLPAQP